MFEYAQDGTLKSQIDIRFHLRGELRQPEGNSRRFRR